MKITFMKRTTVLAAVALIGTMPFFYCNKKTSGSQAGSGTAVQPPEKKNVVVINPSGVTTTLTDEIEKLRALYDQAPAGNPVRTRMLFAMGETFVKYGDVDNAIDCFKGVYKTEPNDNRSCYYLGTLYLFKGDSAQCYKYWKRHLALDPNSSEKKKVHEFLSSNGRFEAAGQ